MVAFAEPSRPTRRAPARQCEGSAPCAPSKNPVLRSDRNQQYSITALTNASGTITERYSYTAYGQPVFFDGSGTVISASAESNRYTYTGREWDQGLSLYHYRARIYDAVAGRFCSRDPIGYEGSSWNLYEYVSGRAASAIDPSGLEWYQAPYNDGPPIWIPDPPPKPKKRPNKPNKKRPFGMGYLWCGCTPKDKRLQPIPGITNPTTNPLPGGTGPSTGTNQIYPFPSVPPTAVGTAGAGTCIALIVKCPGIVAVFHFSGGDDPSGTLKQNSWPAGCDAMICGGDPNEPQSDCLGDDVMSAATNAGFNVVGVSGNSGCGVDANGNWWQYGS